MDNHDLKNFQLLEKIIEEKDILVDVGSNKGEYTDFFLKKIKSTGKIYTIELEPSNSEFLKQKYQHLQNVVIINKAISDIDGFVTFYIGEHNTLHNILGYDTSYRKSDLGGEIESIRLDTLLHLEKKIKLIKIDVEGAELKVLHSIKKIINKVENILVECHLKEDWDSIKNLILNDYNLECFNNSANSHSIQPINNNSQIAYQCFCRKKS